MILAVVACCRGVVPTYRLATSDGHCSVKVTIPCPSSPRPVGGVTVLYEFANALCRRGHDIHLVHAPYFGFEIGGMADLSWFDFEPDIVHHVEHSGTPTLPSADVVFATGTPKSAGLPVHLVQGQNMLMPWMETDAFCSPALRVCVASWLVDAGAPFGVPPSQFHVIHMGIDQDRYRLTTPIENRPLQVAMLHHAHEAKGTDVGLAALAAAQAEMPELQAVLFGTAQPTGELPGWATFHLAPDREQLVNVIYNGSGIFLQPSDHEGFGLTAVEAMACGCALVTTDNGGSRDYAVHGRTALVCPPRDITGLTTHVLGLLKDDAERQRLASAGRARAIEFDWATAGADMESILLRYLADPPSLQSPPGHPPSATVSVDRQPN